MKMKGYTKPGALLFLFLMLATTAMAQEARPKQKTVGLTSSQENSITRAEIEATGMAFQDAYEVVRQFRPQWLIKRGIIDTTSSAQTYDYVVVYQDDLRLGDPESLRTINAANIADISILEEASAQRLGPVGHPHGAIVVRTKSR